MLEMLAVVAYMILQIDLEPINGYWTLPRPKQKSLATNDSKTT